MNHLNTEITSTSNRKQASDKNKNRKFHATTAGKILNYAKSSDNSMNIWIK